MPDEGELLTQKNNLRDLIDLQSDHDVVVSPFDRFPPLENQFLLMSDDFRLTHDQLWKGIEKEKANRLQVIIDAFYREKLERDGVVGVL